MIVFKENVRIKEFSASLEWMLHCLFELVRNRPSFVPVSVMVTSINDSVHSSASKHYTDDAIDVRSHNFLSQQDKQNFLSLYINMLNSHPMLRDHFWGFLEDPGTENEHFHIQVKKGLSFEV